MSARIRGVQNKLISYYRANGRDFPWRHTRDPFQIMIAEFMLQRTRAEQVKPVFAAFINKYPDVRTLARAGKVDMRRILKPLGLNWRRSHFIESAKYITQDLTGTFPRDRQALLRIPGVGDYVAGAILTVAYGKKEYVVDCNIARFVNRYFGLDLTGEIRRRRQIIAIAKKLFIYKHPGMLLFAILDFTAQVCRAQRPRCTACHISPTCKYTHKITAK